jgi:uncharacterized RDD family membrane protein YckC
MFIGFEQTFSAPRNEDGAIVHSAVVRITIELIALTLTMLVGYLWVVNVRGRSVGKRLIGLSLTRVDTGDRPGVVRGSLRMLAQLVTVCTFGVGYAVMLFDRDRRTLYDRVTGTIVIEK